MANPCLLATFHDPVSDANGFIALFAEKPDVGNMEGGFLFQDPSSSLLAVRTRMPLNKIDLFHDDLFFLWKDFEDSATFAPFSSLDHHDQVILFDMKPWDDHLCFPLPSIGTADFTVPPEPRR
jgi:hypothetical protein